MTELKLNQEVMAMQEHTDRRRKDVRILGKITGFSQTHSDGRQVCIQTPNNKIHWVMENKVSPVNHPKVQKTEE